MNAMLCQTQQHHTFSPTFSPAVRGLLRWRHATAQPHAAAKCAAGVQECHNRVRQRWPRSCDFLRHGQLCVRWWLLLVWGTSSVAGPGRVGLLGLELVELPLASCHIIQHVEARLPRCGSARLQLGLYLGRQPGPCLEPIHGDADFCRHGGPAQSSVAEFERKDRGIY
jgi:hypothetical protein